MFGCLFLSLDLGDTSATVSLSGSSVSIVFISGLFLSHEFIDLVSWRCLRVPQCGGHDCSCIFFFLMFEHSILLTSSSVPDVHQPHPPFLMFFLSSDAASHCVFSNIFFIPTSSLIFLLYLFFTHTSGFLICFADIFLYFADFPPQILTEFIYLLMSSFRSLIIFTRKVLKYSSGISPVSIS